MPTLAAFLLIALAVALAYGQAPLYYSNQNQYFLHGLAQGGFGGLEHDWLANTTDPTPLFSGLVAGTYRFLHPALFHFYYGILFAVYLFSLLAIFSHLNLPPMLGGDTEGGSRLVFVAVILAVHSALIRWGSYRLFGLDYPWYLQSGVAGQYVLGAMFQPSTFGVLLILAIALFLRGRLFWAVTSACLGATIHTTYLLGAAMLTLGFIVVLWREGAAGSGDPRRTRDPRRTGAWRLAGWALLLSLPAAIFVAVTFRPTSIETFQQAQHILAQFRIPHHCLPRLWCDEIAVGQIAWVVLALALVRRTRLFTVLLVPLVFATVLTVAQMVTESNTLALLFPWRISAILVPVATVINLGSLIIALPARFDSRMAKGASLAVIGLFAAAGIAIMYLEQGYQSSPEEVAMLDFVRANRSERDVYLIPVKVPDLQASTRGSLSSDFKPAAAKQRDPRLIPVDLQRFRLYTGAPIFVDFKSIPYRDTDVLEWRARLDRNERYYTHLRAGRPDEIREDLRRDRITHVVTTSDQPLEDERFKLVYGDEYYRVYWIRDGVGGPE